MRHKTRPFDWKPTLSIIIPAVDPGSNLTETVKSVISQNFEDFELILAGDSEIIQLEEELFTYFENDSRFRFIKVDSLQSAAIRNVSLENANGTFIYFFQADNLLFPGTVPYLVKLMHESGSEVIGFSGLCSNRKDRNYWHRAEYQKPDVIEPIEGEDLLVQMISSGRYSPEISMYMYRRSFLQNIQRFASDECSGEDEFYTIRTLCMADRALSVSKEFYMLLEEEESNISDQSIINRLKSWAGSISSMLTFVKKHPLKERTQQVILRRARELGHKLVEVIHQLNEEKNLTLSLENYFTNNELAQLGYGVRIRSMYPGLYSLIGE